MNTKSLLIPLFCGLISLTEIAVLRATEYEPREMALLPVTVDEQVPVDESVDKNTHQLDEVNKIDELNKNQEQIIPEVTPDAVASAQEVSRGLARLADRLYGTRPASEEYVKMVQELAQKMAITQPIIVRQTGLRVRFFNDWTDSFALFPGVTNRLYINEEWLNEMEPEGRKFALAVELARLKYENVELLALQAARNLSIATALTSGGVSGFIWGLYKGRKPAIKAIKDAALLTFLVSSIASLVSFFKTRSHYRALFYAADQKALDATSWEGAQEYFKHLDKPHYAGRPWYAKFQTLTNAMTYGPRVLFKELATAFPTGRERHSALETYYYAKY
jgi:hypothetical protein